MSPQTILLGLLFFGFLSVILLHNLSSIIDTNKDVQDSPVYTQDEVNEFQKEIKDLKSSNQEIKNLTNSENAAGGNRNEQSTENIKDEVDNKAKERKHERKMKTSSEKKMNILLLYADDWSFKTLGAAGNKFVKTPYLDDLASKGIHFTHNCVTTSICWISRSSMYTGQYVSRHKCPNVADVEYYNRWNETLYGALANNGYYNGFFGKWHHSYDNLPEWSFGEREFYFGSHFMPDGQHVTEKNQADALRFLRRRPMEKPFILTISFFATHAEDGSTGQYYPQNSSMKLYENDEVPIAPNADVGNSTANWDKLPPFFVEKNEGRQRWNWRFDTYDKYQKMMKNYYRMASEVDKACGKIIQELKRQHIFNRTLIIFTTDNGNYHAEHGLADKWYPHEESIRVPLIVFDPRMPSSKVGTKNDEFTLNIDLAPTILKAAGIDPPEAMQGKDFADLYLKENTPWRKEFFYEWPDPFNQKDWLPAAQALVRKDYKYIYWPQHDYHQLFHLKEDPMEMNDLRHNSSVSSLLDEMKSRFGILRAAAAGNLTDSNSIISPV